MKLRTNGQLVVTIVLAAAIAATISVIPTQPVYGGDLYATGISGGKTKPLIDIDNKLIAPSKMKLRKVYTGQPRHKTTTDTTRQVEDAARYYLYIEPVYPRRARLADKEGVVELQLTFGPDGKMKDALVKNSSSPGWGFEHAALAASLESRLSGHGEREVTVVAKVKFRLE